MHEYRTHKCSDIRLEHVGQEIKLAGWVNSIRNLGGLLFITLRDETGIVQLISEDGEKYNNLTKESTVTVTGVVKKRTEDMINPKMKTGEISTSKSIGIQTLWLKSNIQAFPSPELPPETNKRPETHTAK